MIFHPYFREYSTSSLEPKVSTGTKIKNFIIDSYITGVQFIQVDLLKKSHHQNNCLTKIYMAITRILFVEFSAVFQFALAKGYIFGLLQKDMDERLVIRERRDYYENEISSLEYIIFGDGVGVTSNREVGEYLSYRDVIKGEESFGWKPSHTLHVLHHAMSANNSGEIAKDLRKVILTFLHHSTHELSSPNMAIELFRILNPPTNIKPDADAIYTVVGEVFFFSLTGGELKKEEREAFVQSASNASLFLPNWFNFIELGFKSEDKSVYNFNKFREAFIRNQNCRAIQAALNVETSESIPPNKRFDLITLSFILAACLPPCTLTMAVIDRLWDENNKHYLNNFKNNEEFSRNFILETARLLSPVPIVSVMSTDEQKIVVNEKFQKVFDFHVFSTAPVIIHCSIASANMDPLVFENPTLFNPNRENLDQTVTFNGLQRDIDGPDESRPPRYCPGTFLTLNVVKLLSRWFLPMGLQVENEIDRSDPNYLSNNERFSGLINNRVQLERVSSYFSLNNILTNVPNFEDNYAENLRIYRNAIFNLNYNIQRDNFFKFYKNCFDLFSLSKLVNYAKKLDLFTLFTLFAMQRAVGKPNLFPTRMIDLILPANINVGDPEHPEIGSYIKSFDELGVHYLIYDEDNPPTGLSYIIKEIITFILNSKFIGHKELFQKFNPGEGIGWRMKVFKTLREPNVYFGKTFFTEEGLIRFAFYGISSMYTKKLSYKELKKYLSNKKFKEININELNIKEIDAPFYVNDLTALQDYETRKYNDNDRYARFGACLIFDGKFKPIGIYVSALERFVQLPEERPDNNLEWKYAKYMYRSTMIAHCTLIDHLTLTHMIEANNFVMFTRGYLPHNSNLRKFLKPFTYNTVTINRAAVSSLMNHRGLVERIWGLTYESYKRFTKDFLAEYKLKTIVEKIRDNNMSHEQNQYFNYVFGSNNYLPKNGINHRVDQDENINIEKENKIFGIYYRAKSNNNYEFNYLQDVNGNLNFNLDWDRAYPVARDAVEFFDIIVQYVTNFFIIEYGNDGMINADRTQWRYDHDFDFFYHILATFHYELGHEGIASNKFIRFNGGTENQKKSIVSIINIISQLIANGTCVHEHVGQISDYMLDPAYFGTRCISFEDFQKGSYPEMNVQSYTQALILATLTGIKQPGILQDWSHLIPQNHHHMQNYRSFQENLKNLVYRIDYSNRSKREWHILSFNPRNIEVAVSI